MTTTTQMPAPLDTSVIHSPEVIRGHKAAVQAYYVERRADEAVKLQKSKPAQPRMLTDQEAYELAIAEDNAKKERQLARDVEAMQKEIAKAEFLASSPDSVKITAATPHQLFSELQPWFNKGYQVDLENLRYFVPNCYSVELTKPAKNRGAK